MEDEGTAAHGCVAETRFESESISDFISAPPARLGGVEEERPVEAGEAVVTVEVLVTGMMAGSDMERTGGGGGAH